MTDTVATEKAKPYAVVVVGSDADDAGRGRGLLGTYLTEGDAAAERANADAEKMGIVARYRWRLVAS